MRSDPAAHRALLGGASSAFAGFRWYLRFGLSYRDVEELAERRQR